MAANSHQTTPGASPAHATRSVSASNVLRWIVAIFLTLVLAGAVGVLGLFMLHPDLGEEITIGLNPPQYYADFEAENLILSGEQYQSVWAVAHNSGDNINAVLEGLLYGADMIEMDVVELDGELYSAHNPPIPLLGVRWFKGPPVKLVWAAAGQARSFMLDLKQTNPVFVTRVIDFINSKPTDRPIFVASRDPSVLRQVSQRAPHAFLLLSVPDRAGLDDLLSNHPLTNLVDGVTIRQNTIDEETAALLNDNDLMIFAWVVNDLVRVNELLVLGVDGITSDNLAILGLLGGEAAPVADTNPGGATPAATPGMLPAPASASPPA